MLNNILNIEGASVLSKEQQKSIIGGGDGCYIFIRDSSGNAIGWIGDENGDDLTVASAQGLYNNGNGFSWPNGDYVSGYCCASCPQFAQ